MSIDVTRLNRRWRWTQSTVTVSSGLSWVRVAPFDPFRVGLIIGPSSIASDYRFSTDDTIPTDEGLFFSPASGVGSLQLRLTYKDHGPACQAAWYVAIDFAPMAFAVIESSYFGQLEG